MSKSSFWEQVEKIQCMYNLQKVGIYIYTFPIIAKLTYVWATEFDKTFVILSVLSNDAVKTKPSWTWNAISLIGLWWTITNSAGFISIVDI